MILVFFDLDGTLANNSTKRTMKAEQYYTPAVLRELPANPNVLQIAKGYQLIPNAEVVYMTGRSGSVRDASMDWLRAHGLTVRDDQYLDRGNAHHLRMGEIKEYHIDCILAGASKGYYSLIVVVDDQMNVRNYLRDNADSAVDFIHVIDNEQIVCSGVK